MHAGASPIAPVGHSELQLIRSHQADISDPRQQRVSLGQDRLEEADGGRRIAPLELPVVPGEPLRRELEAFVRACRGEATPLVTGRQGREALATALDVLAAIGTPR